MRYIITIALLFTSCSIFGQKLSENMKVAFKQDDAKLLLSALKEINTSINDCFLLEEYSYSLLSISIKMKKPIIFDALILNKAEIDKICNDKTPLMYACKYGQLEMAKRLISAGAMISLMNKNKETALDYAKKYEKKELETYLLSLKSIK